MKDDFHKTLSKSMQDPEFKKLWDEDEETISFAELLEQELKDPEFRAMWEARDTESDNK